MQSARLTPWTGRAKVCCWRSPRSASPRAWTRRGAIIHRYSYFFAGVDKLGYLRALLNGGAFLPAFYLLW